MKVRSTLFLIHSFGKSLIVFGCTLGVIWGFIYSPVLLVVTYKCNLEFIVLNERNCLIIYLG